MIHWLAVENYFNQKFVPAEQIRQVQVHRVGAKNLKPNCTHQVRAIIDADLQIVVLKTGSEQTCNLFLMELLKQTGKILDPFARFGHETHN